MIFETTGNGSKGRKHVSSNFKNGFINARLHYIRTKVKTIAKNMKVPRGEKQENVFPAVLPWRPSRVGDPSHVRLLTQAGGFGTNGVQFIVSIQNSNAETGHFG
ncbi:hypothetical protein TNCT_667631 [Trichonephila clavata]|uniref:Uncharacterized protein n=1 Tax=Trichonephila clavata TaxID=2740835 RepID=A0A8X6LAE1_TRICU|nr:hypothetical protein TNCT_667631 [Trichonephila clavata]